MKEWFSASELTGLPGMPRSKATVLKRAADEQWIYRDAINRGGPRREYGFSALPEITRTFLQTNAAQRVQELSNAARAGSVEGARITLRETLDGSARHNRRAELLKDSLSLPAAAQARLDTKLEALRLCDLYREAHGITLTQATHAFAEAYNQGRLAIDEQLRAKLPKVSAASLQRWRLQMKNDGITSLAGQYGNRKGTSKIDQQPEMRDFILGVLVKSPHARGTHIMQALRARYRDTEDVVLPSLRRLEAWLKGWKRNNKQTLAAIANPDAWKNKYMVAQGSASESIVRLNQLWEMDSTPADIMLTDGRHSIIGNIDVCSRRGKLLVSKTSKAVSVATLIRNSLLDWGTPEGIKTDNGQDYTAHHTERVLQGLDIHHELCPPFQPWRKPHIERFFRTFSHDLVELLDGFIGHSVAERKSIESRKTFAERLMARGDVIEITMSSAEFQYFCDRWCEDIYQHREHSGLHGHSPFQIAANWKTPVRRIDDERALDLLLAEAPGNGIRVVQKKGIALDDTWFIAPELEAYVGHPVQVRMLPDAGRIVIYGGPDMKFICIATCPERAGIDRQEIAAKARETQKRRVQAERAALRAIAKKAKTDDIVGEILRDRAVQSGKLAFFPKRADAHDTPALRAAAEAATALAPPIRSTSELMTSEDFAAARKRIDEEAMVPQPVFDTPFQRAYWLSQQAYTRALSGEEQDFLAHFRITYPREAQQMDMTMEQRFGIRDAKA